MLEAGHIGVHRMTCDLAMDPDERDRWERERTTRNATIAELTATITQLTQKVAELEAKLAATNSTLDESRTASQSPVVNQTSPAPEIANPIQQASSGDRPDSSPSVAQRLNQMNQRHRNWVPIPKPRSACPNDPRSTPPPRDNES